MTSDSTDMPPRRLERSERRRRARARRFDTTIPSPCISVCQLDDATGCCIGCLRSVDEIRDWMIMTAEEKRAVLDRIETRRADAAPGGSND